MNETWQIVLGFGIGTLVIVLYGMYKSYIKTAEENNENLKLAKISIIFGASGIVFIFLGSLVGITLAVISFRRNKYRALSIIGFVVSLLTMLPWLLVVLLKA
jgi:hypothetical protein